MVKRVFISREHELGGQSELGGKGGEKLVRGMRGRAIVNRLIGNERVIAPDRFGVATPEAVERPARQLLARIPLALAEMRQARRGIPLAQALIQIDRESALILPERRGIPFRAIRIIHGYERRFATHSEAHIERRQVLVDRPTEELNLCPLRLVVGFRHAGRLPDALHTQRMLELNCALFDRSGDRRRS